MEITRKNFKEALPLIKKSIESADFLAIDGEFTGLLSGREVGAFDPPSEYYKRLLYGSTDFLLIQYGLVAFHWNSDSNTYLNDAYTFYLFPRTRPGPDRVFLCQSSSLEFLATSGFDFNKLFQDGIPYLTEPLEKSLREKLEERQKSYSNDEESIIEVPAENKSQIDDICDKIEKFLSELEPESLEIGRCNGFIRKLVFQEVGQRFKDRAYIETKVLENKDRVLKVTRLSSAEDGDDRENDRKQREWNELEEAVGFSKVARMITESEKLVIGHNMLLDVLHTLNHFYQPLPEDYSSFKEFTHCMFPRLLDTKYMSSLPPFKDKVNSSMLSHLLATLSAPPFSMPVTSSLEGRGYAAADSKHHEAGYDAYITGLCFLSMYAHLARVRGDTTPSAARVVGDSDCIRPYLNRLYLFKTAHQDSPYINLVGKDPEPSRDHVFHVTFPKEWGRNDIVQLFSPFGSVFVQFVDDTSALVGLNRREQARAAAKTFATTKLKGAIVKSYAHYRQIYGKTVGAKQSLWLKKQTLDDFRQRAQAIAATKVVSSLESPVPPASPPPAQPTLPETNGSPKAASPKIETDDGFIPLKQSKPGEDKPTARKRTSLGVFVIDVNSPVEAPTAKKSVVVKGKSETRRERRGKKHQVYEEMVFPTKPLAKNAKSKEEPQAKRFRLEDFEDEPATKPVAAFEESDNWE